MTYIANDPNVYEDEKELYQLLEETGCRIFTYNSMRRITRKNVLVRLRGGKCERCGYCKNVAALDFHHPNKEGIVIHRALCDFSDKQFNEILIPEVQKHTILLCANCHREEHN